MAGLHFRHVLVLLNFLFDPAKAYEYHYHAPFRGIDVPGQEVVSTMGDGGVKCGKQVFKCGVDAVCDQGTSCTCPVGTSGDPHYYCIPDDYYISYVTGDPRLTMFDGTTVHVFYPCRVRLTHVKTKHSMGNSGGDCQLEVHVINFHYKNGYYILGFDLKGSITDNDNPSLPGRFSLRIFGFGENGVFVFKEQGKTNSIHHLVPWGAPAQLKYMNTMVQTEYDSVHNMAIVNIEACGIKTTFRPLSSHSHQKPGFSIAVKKKPGVEFPDDGFPIASSPFNKGEATLIRRSRKLMLTKAETVLALAVSQQTYQDFGDSSMSCYIATRESTVICPTFRQRAFAIKHCGFLYIEKEVSSCLKANAFGESTGSVFAMCVQAMCLGHSALCRVVRAQLNHYRCPISRQFSSLACFKIKRQMMRMYPRKIRVR